MSLSEFMATLPARIDYKLGLHKYMQHSSLPHNQVRLRVRVRVRVRVE